MRHAQILVQEATTVLAMKDTLETGKRAKVLSLNINCLVYLNFPSELHVGECYVYFTLIAENNMRIIIYPSTTISETKHWQMIRNVRKQQAAKRVTVQMVRKYIIDESGGV